MIRCIYKHLRTGNLYFVDSVARNVHLNNKMVVYSQLESSVERGTGKKIPEGQTWVRNHDDFITKFEKVEQDTIPYFLEMTSINMKKELISIEADEE